MQNPSAHESTGLQSQPPPEEQNYGATEAHERQGPFVSVSRNRPAKRGYLTVGVLCYANLINFMDWFIVPGILLDIQQYFNLRDEEAGLLQTAFILCYMVAAPFFGYLGDRYNRKIILGAGIFFWSAVTLGTSFISESYHWMFFLSRGLVGIGTASYSTVAPTIIADQFDEGKRTTMLSVFYICIPVGSGLGYVLASSMANVTGDWHWAFRVTPCLGGIALVLLIKLVPHKIQRRTEAHRALSISGTIRVAAEKPGVQRSAKTTWWQDVISLGKNCSFVWSTLGLTAMAFVTGALGMWVPMFLYRAQVVQGTVSPCVEKSCNSSNSLIFGGITIGTGILGVVAGAEAARRLRKINNRADPLICATSMFVSALCLFIALMMAQRSITSTFIFIALGELFLSANWAVVTDILLYVVTPRRQSTAIALQILVSHLLGDAGSPYLVGAISSVIQANNNHSVQWSFRSLQYSFIICVFVGVIGGGFFLLTSFYVEDDRKEAEKH
uniref:SPNS lysolipid transporter 3, sphingosine-1-phosphate (putative) n=1 Tax=Anas platyrhynchos TaxID=8839 RepID=A0A8B9TLT7_ANAPL|nr:protein spinster homolog 3 isoform X1 [Anas platyrhynchos]XP_038021704.1 protein spinster homolog 3 isoform X1 [Anas platyrhynchos]|eukprot:XP_027301788.1 protein spinster homolog 3 isoform X1 [Anas platyrhynchos]